MRRWLMFLPLLGVVLFLPIAAQAAVGPVQVPLRDPGPAGCPTGTFVATDPGSAQSPFFLFKAPGPVGCAPGIDELRAPGPQGIAMALPLTAADCAQGTALFDTQLLMIGAGLPGPIAGAPASSACPAGGAAMSALQAAIANVPVAPDSSGLDRANPAELVPAIQGQGGHLVVDLGTGTGMHGFYGLDASGTLVGQEVLVAFEEGNPDQPLEVLNLEASPTPGVSVLKTPGPGGAPVLDGAV